MADLSDPRTSRKSWTETYDQEKMKIRKLSKLTTNRKIYKEFIIKLIAKLIWGIYSKIYNKIRSKIHNKLIVNYIEKI